jgi:hypothetical protein
MYVGMRRLAAVVVVAACAGLSARLWSDALTPTTSPYIEPFAFPDALSGAPPIVVVTGAKSPAAHGAPKVVRKSTAKGALVARGTIVRAAPIHTPVAPAPKTPTKKPVPAPHTPPPVAAPAPPAPSPSTPTPTPTPTPAAAAAPSPTPTPSPPAAAVPITPPVVQPVAPPPVQQPAPAADDTSRPGNGYGDKNHAHTGPPGQPGK